MRLVLFAAAIVTATLATGCNNASSTSHNDATANTRTLTVNGTAAVGAAVAIDQPVVAICENGEQYHTQITDNHGHFQLTVADDALPCALQTTTASSPEQLHSYIATGERVNITPFTDMAIAIASSDTPSNWFNSVFNGTLTTRSVDDSSFAEQLANAATQLKDALSATFGVELPDDIFTAKFEVGDNIDQLIDAVMAAIQQQSDTDYHNFINELAGNNTPTPPTTDNTTTPRADDPAYSVDSAALEAALDCPAEFTHSDKAAVLLVHGTFTKGTEQYTLFYRPQLEKAGHDVCVVTYPDRGLGDLQIAAEYVVYAVHKMFDISGNPVSLIGHSQGALMPRWAIKFFPSLQEEIDDFILIAGPNHGTELASLTKLSDAFFGNLPTGTPGLVPAGLFQMSPDSKFIDAINQGDEAPGNISYTNIYSRYDEVVFPNVPELGAPTSALNYQADSAYPRGENGNIANILVQDTALGDLCAAHIAEHVTIGTTDPVAFAIARDALKHPGTANMARIKADHPLLCVNPLPLDLADLLDPTDGFNKILGLLSIIASEADSGIPNPHPVAGDPPLKAYALDALAAQSADNP